MAERSTFAALLAERDVCHETMADAIDDDNDLDDLYEVRARLVWLEDEILTKVEEATPLLDAATDMLASLEECITDEDACSRVTQPEYLIRRLEYINSIARQAIAKAKGENK